MHVYQPRSSGILGKEFNIINFARDISDIISRLLRSLNIIFVSRALESGFTEIREDQHKITDALLLF